MGRSYAGRADWRALRLPQERKSKSVLELEAVDPVGKMGVLGMADLLQRQVAIEVRR